MEESGGCRTLTNYLSSEFISKFHRREACDLLKYSVEIRKIVKTTKGAYLLNRIRCVSNPCAFFTRAKF